MSTSLNGLRMTATVPRFTFEQFARRVPEAFSAQFKQEPQYCCVKVPPTPDSLQPHLSLLTGEETARSDRFKNHGARMRFLTAHTALHLVLKSLLAEDHTRIRLRETENHKPFVAFPDGTRPLEFNLSHCQDWVALIIGPQPVGIDIEGHRKMDSLEGVAGLVFTQAEKSVIFNGNEVERLIRFYRHWSCKEAYLKACGTGLTRDPKTLEIAFGTENSPGGKTVWWTEEIPGHCLAWAESPNP